MSHTVATNEQYDEITAQCRQLFLAKTADYGTSWRVLRPISVRDQIYIKAQRIRNIQESCAQRVADSIETEFTGIINYAVIGLIQGQLAADAAEELSVREAAAYFDEAVQKARSLMQAKNHDYGEAWRSMSEESFVDLILAKLLRVRQIIINDGLTRVSEGIDANLLDILNYGVFALILRGEKTSHRL